MPRCQYPKCERIVREPNKFQLCHVHIDLADFFIWFSGYLQSMEQSGAAGGARRASGLIVPPGST